MADLSKVIRAFSCCFEEFGRNVTSGCGDCPYFNLPDGQNCINVMHRDAFELLKEQLPDELK